MWSKDSATLHHSPVAVAPVQWSTAVPIGSVESGISGDALASANDGSAIFVAISWGGQTAVYESLKPSYGASWTDLTPTPLSGADPQLSFGGSAALLTTVNSGSVVATTFYLAGTPSSVSTSCVFGLAKPFLSESLSGDVRVPRSHVQTADKLVDRVGNDLASMESVE